MSFGRSPSNPSYVAAQLIDKFKRPKYPCWSEFCKNHGEIGFWHPRLEHIIFYCRPCAIKMVKMIIDLDEIDEI